jgi:hypothetical protein
LPLSILERKKENEELQCKEILGTEHLPVCVMLRVISMRFQTPHPAYSVSNKLKSTKLLVAVTFFLFIKKKETQATNLQQVINRKDESGCN